MLPATGLPSYGPFLEPFGSTFLRYCDVHGAMPLTNSI
ncbi:hypothetical protein ABMA08_11695 [Pseudomonas yamanorum]